MKPNPYLTYENALRDYLTKFGSLIEPPQASESVMGRAEEIADASSALIRLAQKHLNSPDLNIQETIRFHFIVQATAELLLGIEILQASGEKNGNPSTAAMKATKCAALREAVSAIEKAGKTLRHMNWFEVVETRGHIQDGKVAHFQVALKVGFRLED